MKATHKLLVDDTPIAYVSVKYQISAHEIEYYVQYMMQSGNMKPSMISVKQMILRNLALSGEAAFDGILNDETSYKSEAHEYCKRVFPTFYL